MKKLMVIFSDNADVSELVLGEYPDGLLEVFEWINNDMLELNSTDHEEVEYSISFRYMTQQEIDNLSETDI